jgi:hypothetical protein
MSEAPAPEPEPRKVRARTRPTLLDQLGAELALDWEKLRLREPYPAGQQVRPALGIMIHRAREDAAESLGALEAFDIIVDILDQFPDRQPVAAIRTALRAHPRWEDLSYHLGNRMPTSTRGLSAAEKAEIAFYNAILAD